MKLTPWLSGFVNWASLVVLVLCFAGQLVTIWWYPFVPLHDLPNHAARHYLEYLALSGQPLPAGYEVEFRILPNLGADLIIPPLTCLFPLLVACKIFLSLAVVVYWLGPALFILQQGGRRPEAFFATLLLLPWVFGQAFFWGYLNYYLGVGCAFLTLTHYCWLVGRNPVRRLDLGLSAAFITLLFFCHQVAWMIYGLCMACRLACDTWQRFSAWRPTLRRAVILALPALPSLVLFALYVLNQSPNTNPNQEARWVGWWDKYRLVAREFRAYDRTIDVVTAALWLAAVAAAWGSTLFRWGPVASLAPEYGGMGRKCRPRSWLPLCLAALVVVFVLAPTAYAGAQDPDSRVLPAILVIVLALAGRLPSQRPGLALGLLTVCIVLHYGSIFQHWGRLSDRLIGEAKCLASLEPNARVLPVLLNEDWSYQDPEPHLCCWAVPWRGAFVASVWAVPEPMPLIIRNPPKDWADVDYLWIYNPNGLALDLPASYREVCSSASTSLWKVR